MPELPEVETIRRDLQKAICGQKIARVIVRKPKLVRGSVRSLQLRLKGEAVSSVNRRGKLLIVALSPSKLYLLLHMKMTGQLIYQNSSSAVAGGHSWPPVSELPGKYTHIEFHFTDGSILFFNDLRQFGYVQLVSEAAKKQIEDRYGIEPLSRQFTVDKLSGVLKARKTSLKNVLLDQHSIAGLGNIYVDEAVFRAKILPMREANSLTPEEIKRLHKAIKDVLEMAIKYRGTTFNNYRDASGRRGDYVRRLKVYGRAGEACRRCGAVLLRVKTAGRGTVYCPDCQA